MILKPKDLDTTWAELLLHCKDDEAAKAEILAHFSEEPDDEHWWTVQDIFEQMNKIIRRYS